MLLILDTSEISRLFNNEEVFVIETMLLIKKPNVLQGQYSLQRV